MQAACPVNPSHLACAVRPGPDICAPPRLAPRLQLHCQGEDVFPIPGTTKVANLQTNVGAADIALKLDKAVVERIGPKDAKPTAGDRYPAGIQQMSFESRGK